MIACIKSSLALESQNRCVKATTYICQLDYQRSMLLQVKENCGTQLQLYFLSKKKTLVIFCIIQTLLQSLECQYNYQLVNGWSLGRSIQNKIGQSIQNKSSLVKISRVKSTKQMCYDIIQSVCIPEYKNGKLSNYLNSWQLAKSKVKV